jgi:hypothetical protein
VKTETAKKREREIEKRNRELLCSVFLLLAGTTQGKRRACFFFVWFGFGLRE